jgi:bacteriocin biosynthesis cyclodehydratase domain-containing protein
MTLRRPRIKRTTQQAETPNGDLYLLRPSAGKDIRIEKPSGGERRLLRALDGTRTRPELEAEFGEAEVREALGQLQALGALEDASDDDLIPPDTLARFDRQLRYFSDISTGPTASQCQAKLEAARVAVLGVGGLGSWSALTLACCGVGEMLLLDFDHVELDNFNRQILFTEADLGASKARVAGRRLKAFNSSMRIEVREERLDSEAAVAQAIDGYDLVIDAVDWPAYEIEHWINSACFSAGIPFIAMSHVPPVARVGPFYVPGRTGCYVCQEISYRRDYPLYDVMVEQQRARPSPAATLGPACALIGGQVALDALHYLTGLAEPSTLGTIHILDLRTMAVKREPVVPEASCPVCGDTTSDLSTEPKVASTD